MTAALETVPVVGAGRFLSDDVKPDLRRAPGRSALPGGLRLIAIHEAAHAVTAVRVGIGVERVTIAQQMVDATLAALGERDPAADGVCLLAGKQAAPNADFTKPHRWLSLENEIRVGLAAPVAEARELAVAVFSAPSWPSEYALAARLADRRGVPPAEINAFVNWLLESADRLVDIWWDDVLMVAELLERQGTIDGPRLHALLSTPRHRAIAASCEGRRA